MFDKYVDFFWGQRKNAEARNNRTKAALCKLLLNSLYGKFGQAGRVYNDVGNDDRNIVRVWSEWDADTGTARRLRSFGGVIQEQSSDEESSNSHPAIAATITSAARIMLLKLIRKAGDKNVIYVDTDSLMLNEDGFQALQGSMASGVLGKLKWEWSSEDVVIYGLKDYMVNGKLKAKGVRKNAVAIGPNSFSQETFRGYKGMLRDGDLENMRIRRGTKTLRREYQKGNVGADRRVSPYDFS